VSFLDGLLNALLYKGQGQPQGLGRRIPTDWSHVDKYPLRALSSAVIPTGVPLTIGVNWYSDFDTPVKDSNGRYWIARDGITGSIRGGHCVCVKTSKLSDPLQWWDFYDQGHEGACVGFGSSRMMSLLNRKRYFARWLWDHAKATDEWGDTNPGDDNGTSVHAAMAILAQIGHVPWKRGYASLNVEGDGPFVAARDALIPGGAEGIVAYRWATTVDEMRTVLASPLHDRLQAFPLLNSWGRFWPRVVWLPYKVMERLLHEEGEVALVTDR
jgi:hypothetical protein